MRGHSTLCGLVAAAAFLPSIAVARAPAARVGDLVSSPIASASAPIQPPGSPTVLVCGKPAARVGDSVSFVHAPPNAGPLPSVLVNGSSTVLIAGKPAARIGDTTSVGGAIIGGCPTVLIGP